MRASELRARAQCSCERLTGGLVVIVALWVLYALIDLLVEGRVSFRVPGYLRFLGVVVVLSSLYCFVKPNSSEAGDASETTPRPTGAWATVKRFLMWIIDHV